MKLNVVKMFALMTAATAFVGCSSSTGQTYLPSSSKAQRTQRAQASTPAPLPTADASHDTALLDGDPSHVWDKLRRISTAKLAEEQSHTDDQEQSAWIQLAVISKQKNITNVQLAAELKNWRDKNPSHPGNKLFPDDNILTQIQAFSAPKQIAVLLPESGAYANSGQVIKEGFLNAYYANLTKSAQQNVKFYDTTTAKSMDELYQQAITEGADFVVGPLLKPHVQQLNGIGSFNVPVLALNYTDSSLPGNFYEFGLLPEDEAAQLADRAFENGKSHAIVIAPQNNWGKRLVTAFTKRWEAAGGSVQDSWYYSTRSKFNDQVAALLKVNPETDKLLMQDDDNKNMLSQQRRQDFDVVILFAQPQDARVIVPLLRYYYVNNIPVYATSSVYSGKPNPIKDVDLNGIIVCDIPWKLQANQGISVPSHDRLYAVGQDAYKLSQSLQRLSQINNFPLYGTTGALTMAQDQKIHRRLPCITVRNGLL